MKELINTIHNECPNEAHCTKEDEKCCYLINQKCLIRKTRKYKGGIKNAIL